MVILVNNQGINTFNFPGGECHVSLSPDMVTPKTLIHAMLNSSDDIMVLLLTVDALRRILPSISLHLIIPYFPYARQDRVCNLGEALSVKVMANLINSLRCDRTTIIDPHSEVTSALVDNCDIITQADIITDSFLKDKLIEENWALIAPDSGAEKKTLEVAKRLGLSDVFCATKIRDTKTGIITATHFDYDIEGRKLLIVDDICDGGRTFIELGKLLKHKKPDEISLYITHGIFSKGLQVLKPYFSQIYCYHTMLPLDNQDKDFLQVLSYSDLSCTSFKNYW